MRLAATYRGARRNIWGTVIAGVGEGRRWLNPDFARLKGDSRRSSFDEKVVRYVEPAPVRENKRNRFKDVESNRASF